MANEGNSKANSLRIKKERDWVKRRKVGRETRGKGRKKGGRGKQMHLTRDPFS